MCTSRQGFSGQIVSLPENRQHYKYNDNADLSIVETLGGRKQLVLSMNILEKNWFAILEPLTKKFSYKGCRTCASATLNSSQMEDTYSLFGKVPISIVYNDTRIRVLLKNSAVFLGVGVFFGSFLLSGGWVFWGWAMAISPAKRLEAAITQGEIEPYFQLIVDSDTGDRTHCEVLARWTQGGSTMTPDVFIPLAESTGSIDVLLLSLIQRTKEMTAKNPYFDTFTFSFNVCPSQLERPDFVEQLESVCQSNLPFSIALEITEREPFQNPQEARKTLDRLAKLGVILELDDAGTGYGSFSYIQDFGFHILKIDKMFVDTIMIENIENKVLDGIIDFGHTVQMLMIAEGVEHDAQVQYLRAKGVYLHQGYYYHKPLNSQDFIEGFVSLMRSSA